jgi:hypothetical protein
MRTKFFTPIILTICMLLAVPTFQVLAETPTVEPITGTIQSITLNTDPVTSEVVSVKVVLRTADGTQPLTLTLENAQTLGLITVVTGPPQVVSVVDTMIGQPISIDPTLTLELGELVTHPVANALGDFLSSVLGVDASAILAYHEQGMGFGEIAQAGFMALALDGDSGVFSAILDAKKSGDYSAVVLPDGSTASNWGQLRKSVFTNDKNLKNLGAVMSGRAEKENGKQNQNEHGKGKGGSK